MSSPLVTALLWTTALGSGLMAGVYWAFSGFIMEAFRKIGAPKAIAAMNSINETILHSSFMPLFFGTSMMSVLLVVVAVISWSEPNAMLILIAGLVYFIGMFICTLVFNVPLNQSLAKLEPDSSGAQEVWDQYQTSWTKWNHLRAISSLITCVLSIWLLSNE